MVARAEDEVGPAVRRGQELGDLLGQVLSVRIEGHHRVAASPEQGPEGGDEGRTLAAVHRVRHQLRARPTSGLCRRVGGAVVHHDHVGQHLARAPDDVGDGRAGLERGDGGRDPHQARSSTIQAPAPPPAREVTRT
jgi:hypothetical protein